MIAGGNALAGPVVRTWQGPGSIPGWGTKKQFKIDQFFKKD